MVHLLHRPVDLRVEQGAHPCDESLALALEDVDGLLQIAVEVSRQLDLDAFGQVFHEVRCILCVRLCCYGESFLDLAVELDGKPVLPLQPIQRGNFLRWDDIYIVDDPIGEQAARVREGDAANEHDDTIHDALDVGRA